MGYTHSIKELGSFGYILLLVSLKPSPLSPCVCIKIFSILKKKKKKKKKEKEKILWDTQPKGTLVGSMGSMENLPVLECKSMALLRKGKFIGYSNFTRGGLEHIC